ncbi:response regulator [Allopontixanthobacter sediminis]|uniref:Response regulator n=1 Tax=Allopontixanthobacter sediminis TaxID=1689985 RepID=A0A845B4Q0_9SPHN|nr:response regulator [Allopontixanthobacter sediminis]MXP45388.1 response regulator [Allopontixanthobacter sediminis]
MHVLIIEDEALVALLIEDYLRDHGYTTFEYAATEAEAVAAAKDHCPNLITSDVRLLEGCGISAVQEICRDELIPVVFITATCWEVTERAPGAIVIEKPFTSTELASALIAIESTFRRS